MKPWELLGEARSPDGTALTLTRHDREYVIMANGRSLMSSRMHGSEQALASLALRGLDAPEPSVLVGGLGMGFTLRAALDVVTREATVLVAELVPAVVEWNRGPLAPLAGEPLRDKRVTVEIADVAEILHASRRAASTRCCSTSTTGRMRSRRRRTRGSMAMKDWQLRARRSRPGGVLAVWSAWEQRRFEQRLRYAGFTVRVERVRARLEKGGPKHTIFLARRGE